MSPRSLNHLKLVDFITRNRPMNCEIMSCFVTKILAIWEHGYAWSTIFILKMNSIIDVCLPATGRYPISAISPFKFFFFTSMSSRKQKRLRDRTRECVQVMTFRWHAFFHTRERKSNWPTKMILLLLLLELSFDWHCWAEARDEERRR